MKKLPLLITVLTFFIFGLLIGCEMTEQQPKQVDNTLFSEIFEHLENNHYKQPSEEDLWMGAINGMIDALDDPYSRYFSQEEYENFQNSMGESFVGIGVTIENINERVVVRKVWSSSPAERAGIRAGDIITHVDGVDYTNDTYYDIVSAVTGEEGSEVEIGVQRTDQNDTLYFTMTRESIDNPTVVVEVFEENNRTIGYIKVNTFGTHTFSLFASYLQMLEDDDNIDGLVIDLRDNGGGYLTTVQNMLNVFLVENDTPMFSIEEYSNNELEIEEYYANNDSQKDYNIVTLINEYSASASEVFAAGMKEHADYPVVGTTSFGKGTMQVTKPLVFGGGDELHTSTGKWKTPNGNWINNDGGDYLGVEPTLSVEQNPYFYTYRIFLTENEELTFDTVSTKTQNAQMILNALGYEVREDGYFDAHTQEVIRTIQAEQGLTVTETINAETANYLSNAILAYFQSYDNDTQLQAAIDVLSND